MKVSCSSEGADSPQYSWTLNGRTLTDSELLSGNTETNSITLKQHVSGQLVCSVRNDVSSDFKEVKISTCGFIFINCTSPKGTHISQWVYEANNTLCIEPTTASTPITVTEASTVGMETYCDGRQNGAQCYGALGGTVVLQLMDNASEIHKYQLLKNKSLILVVRRNNIVSNLIASRSIFTPSNGIFRINKLSRTDGGEYKLETFNAEGRGSDRALQLTIQAPVSSVLLVSECLSQGEMKVSCSSEGADSPQYSWTLDGRTLTDSELLSGNTETNIITLQQHVSGQLVCSVRNDVSSDFKEVKISTCGFIFIDCTSPKGTHISQWVYEANNTLCIEPTTASTPITVTEASTVGMETYCDGRQNGAQCYGALGGTVVLQLMDNASEIPRYQLLKNKSLILVGRRNNIVSNLIASRSIFTPSNGIFRINKLSRTDGGEYKLITFNAEGRISERSLQLTIQAPVSSVLLVSECLSQGEMKVSCSSEGADSPQYSWTLDGRTLTDSELLSGNTETNIITLKQHVSGQLVCSVRNDVSSDFKEVKISTCGFIFINCTSPKGTHISQWVYEANNTLCIEPTTASTPITVTEASTVGMETYCDGRQNGAQCYGALGGTVVLQLMDNASEIPRYQLLKKSVILVGRRNNILSNLIANRSIFTPSNGTFRINKLSRTDGGEYKLETFNAEGRGSERALLLTIQAPVSSVLLVSECLSQGEMKVSCSSEGADSPQYSWTLDGRTLTDSELLSGNTETNIITLKQHGQLVCSVRNDVSSDFKEVKISTCGFIFINCTSPNGTHISQWVYEANNTLCIEPTTASTPITITEASTVGMETYCDGRQNGAQCYGALGGTVVLQLMDNASEIPRYQLLKNKSVILVGRRNNIVSNLIASRSIFTPSNGTFRINKLSRTDGGEYKLITFNAEGHINSDRALQLTIQAPVSSVLLVSECLSQGEMKVSCSSEGADSPQYSWTLNGRTLTDSELLSGNTETNSITLQQHGQLVCSVRNDVSGDFKEVNISTCGFTFINCTSLNGTHISQWVYEANNTLCIEPTTASTTITITEASTVEKGYLKIIAGVLAALVILLVVGVAVICAQKKKKNNKPKEEDDQELTYADVKIFQRPGRQRQQRAETEVEYGQLVFSERPPQTEEPAKDECVYAKVRKGR
ncbi:hemicentin-1-like isoform X2 [Anoplopoma fimbria]|uniref:hemicentin-1-like isoform X2 n=1 Tax=Anoplopoma fimbria TaxID=229290 RepID=UPI0023EC0166|nr:hemicentin-1-like isoform X2 [Anoplopoma fimbria]